MSGWDMYITNLEASAAHCSYAAIYGKQGGKWAESQNKTNFPVTEEEVMVGVRALADQDQNIMTTGLVMGGTKFTCILLDTDVLVCQGKGIPNRDLSLVFAMSEQAVIVGFNPEGTIKTQIVRSVLELLKDYLKRVGY